MPRSPLRPGRLAVIGLATVATLAGCSGSHTPGSHGSGSQVTTVSKSFTLAGQRMQAAIPAQPAASTPTGFPGVDFEVYQLLRRGAAIYMVGAMDNTSSKPTSDLSQALGNNNSTDLAGVSLFDPIGLKQYLPFAEPSSAGTTVTCLCSDTYQMDPIAPHSEFYVAAVFPAPPADVTSMSVITPAGTVSSVPISG